MAENKNIEVVGNSTTSVKRSTKAKVSKKTVKSSKKKATVSKKTAKKAPVKKGGKKTFKRVIKNVGHAIKKEFGIAKKGLHKAEREFTKVVSKNPKKSVAISAGVGAAIATAITIAVLKHKQKKKHLFGLMK